MDYHAWRMAEQLGIFIMIAAVSNAGYALTYRGLTWMMTFTVYEPTMNKVIYGRATLFNDVNAYNIFGWTFNMGRVIQVIITLLGGILFIKGLICLGIITV
jgi:hypothetical protein